MRMKKIMFANHYRLRVIWLALILLSSGCGVEAGNPNSSGGKLFAVYVAPTSYNGVEDVSALVDSVKLFQGEKSYAKNYESQKVYFASKQQQTEDSSTLALNLENITEESLDPQKLEIVLSESSTYLDVTLNTAERNAKAVILDESGNVSRSLIFNGQMTSANSTDLLIDVELRKTLKPITPEQRTQLNLPDDVAFVIQQKHSFMPKDEAGSIAFSGFIAGSLLCVFKDSPLPNASPDACTESGYKSQIVSSDGTAVLGSLRSGEYQVVNVTGNNQVNPLENVTVEAGKKVSVAGK